MKKLILTIAIIILLSIGCSCGSGGDCPTDPPYQPTIGPLNPESEWMEGMDWACPRGYKDTGCGQCHIIY